VEAVLNDAASPPTGYGGKFLAFARRRLTIHHVAVVMAIGQATHWRRIRRTACQ
jgi:hypothetical protein